MSASFRLQYPRAADMLGRKTINPWTLIDDKRNFLETRWSIRVPFSLVRIFVLQSTARNPAIASEERAARFKTVGDTATAFVTDQEQAGDVEAGFLKGHLGIMINQPYQTCIELCWVQKALLKWLKLKMTNCSEVLHSKQRFETKTPQKLSISHDSYS